MDATEKSDQRREEETEGEDEEEAPEEGAEGPRDVRILTSNDLRLAMIPGYTEYAKDYEANKAKAEMRRLTNELRKDLDRKALYGIDPVP